jgi:hypothetical protein
MDFVFVLLPVVACIVLASIVIYAVVEHNYRKLEDAALDTLGFSDWNIVSHFDDTVIVKSRQSLEKYDDIKFFRENHSKLARAESILKRKQTVAAALTEFLNFNEYETHKQYQRLKNQIYAVLNDAQAYRVHVKYISSAGNHLGSVTITVTQRRLNAFKQDPSLLMTKGEYSKYIKEHQKEALEKKQHEYYEKVNAIIDFANQYKDSLIIKGDSEQIDSLISQLFDKTINNIQKIKAVDDERWAVLGGLINRYRNEIENIVKTNQQILFYYDSPDFLKIKQTCEALMSTQREFNEYITKKVQSISQLFGTRVVREETINNDEYNYVRPYRKTITPFTAEVSAAVFASAENSPLEYIVKNFYPNKKQYPEQIRNLYLLVEELETLKDAKKIIDTYKTEYQQYLGDVPAFILEKDEAGFYSRLGFATIDESVLSVEYRFCYTSGGGLVQRSFAIPMTEETIAELIKLLESKLTASAFAKEQRYLMTRKLRDAIKLRDNFTCCICGNSTHVEPNLLLEIDHIVPIAKGGCTVEENLQTLCWKCNRTKSDKIIL